MLTCIIRYEIDPTKKAQFEQYARNWGIAIPRCGADLIGYYAPHEGSPPSPMASTTSHRWPPMNPTAHALLQIPWAKRIMPLHNPKSSSCEKIALS